MGTDCTGDFAWEKAIEKTILRVLGSSEFSHSLGQKLPKWDAHATSAFPLIAIEERTSRDVSNAPNPDVANLSNGRGARHPDTHTLDEAKALQRPLSDDALKSLRGEKRKKIRRRRDYSGTRIPA